MWCVGPEGHQNWGLNLNQFFFPKIQELAAYKNICLKKVSAQINTNPKLAVNLGTALLWIQSSPPRWHLLETREDLHVATLTSLSVHPFLPLRSFLRAPLHASGCSLSRSRRRSGRSPWWSSPTWTEGPVLGEPSRARNRLRWWNPTSAATAAPSITVSDRPARGTTESSLDWLVSFLQESSPGLTPFDGCIRQHQSKHMDSGVNISPCVCPLILVL